MVAAHRGRRLQHEGRMHLVVERELLEISADGVAGDPPVLVDSLDLVAALAAQVERGAGPLAHAAEASGEGALAAVRLPADHRRPFSRASSSFRVLRLGSSTTAS